MSNQADRSSSSFTAAERGFIRREMDTRFGQCPSLAEGVFLRNRRDGPRKDEPRLPAAVQSMLERGLIEVQPGPIGHRAMFTAAGMEALRRLLQDRRAMDPARFAHLRHEIGLDDSVPETKSLGWNSEGQAPRRP